jgi:hypothetical protein
MLRKTLLRARAAGPGILNGAVCGSAASAALGAKNVSFATKSFT